MVGSPLASAGPSASTTADDRDDTQTLGAAHEAAPETTPRRSQRTGRRAKAAVDASALTLDLEAVADVEGLAEEVAMLRASIRELVHPHGGGADLAEHVKILAELRHQVEALCSTLKAQQALEGAGGRRGGVSAAELTRTLDELGDRLGVPR